MARKRIKPTPKEQAMGVQGPSRKIVSQALDFFQNMPARTGFGTPSLLEGTQYPLVRFTYNYWELISLYEGHWIVRRIVDVPAEDMVRAWPRIVSELKPEDITRIDQALRRTRTRQQMLTSIKWARLFGGAGCLMVIDGHENKLDEPLKLDDVEPGAFKGLIPFDRWCGIMPEGEVCTDFSRPTDVNLPEFYRVQVQGGRESFKVHASRILRFTGPTNPTPEREAYSYWGISVIEPLIEEIRKRDNVSWNIVNLTFRANVMAMKNDQAAQALSGVGMNQRSAQQWSQTISQINHLMSNQSLIPVPKDGGLDSIQYTFTGLSDCYQQFQLDISGAAQIPVTRLWGRTITGLGQSNDADERIYEERIATDQEVQIRPQIEKLYPVLCMSELGEVPDDLDLIFPSVRVLDEREKVDLAKTVMDTVAVGVNTGLMSPQVAGKEIKQSSSITGIGSNYTDEDIEKLSDEVSGGEFGDFLKEDQLDPAESPTKVLREEDRKQK